MKSRNRTLVLSALAVVAVACSDATSPSELASRLGDSPDVGAEVPRGDLAIRGVVLRYSGRSDSTRDTLGALVAVPNAQVEAWYLGPIGDSVPDDSIPRDSVPRDSVVSDTARADSSRHNDSLSLARATAALARAGTPRSSLADTSGGSGGSGPKRAGSARTNAYGYFTLDRLGKGVYRVDVTPQGGNAVRAFTWVELRDSAWVRFTLPPR